MIQGSWASVLCQRETNVRLSFAQGTLLLEGEDARRAPSLFAGVPWQFDSRAGGWRVDAIWYETIRERAATAGWATGGDGHEGASPNSRLAWYDFVPQWGRVAWPHVHLPELRPEQAAAVEAWTRARRGCVVMPTGTGKTNVALTILAAAPASTLIVAPVRDLMYQWHQRLLAGLGYDAGIIGDSVYRVKPLSVTTYDSACIHMERLGDRFERLVFDECHHLPGSLRRDAALMSAAPQRLGLTATFQRSDGRHVDLEQLIGPVVYELPLREVKGRSLADYEVVKIPIHLSAAEQARYDRLSREVREFMAERRRDDPQFSWERLCAQTALDPAARRALKAFHLKASIEDRAVEKLRILEDLFRLHADEPCLIFTGTNAMARDVSRRFLIPCLLSHCGKHERLDVLRGLESGVYPALVANQVLDEGVDLPAVKVAIVLGGRSSTRQAQQRLGRILRKSGNSRAVLYEVVCVDTKEEERSRRRRSNDAYADTKHLRRKK